MSEKKLHVIVYEEDGLAVASHGADPANAVEAHYAHMDMYCSPSDPELHEVFTVTVYAIPGEIEEMVQAEIDAGTGDEACAFIEELASKRGDLRGASVDVIYTMNGATATMADISPGLFG